MFYWLSVTFEKVKINVYFKKSSLPYKTISTFKITHLQEGHDGPKSLTWI